MQVQTHTSTAQTHTNNYSFVLTYVSYQNGVQWNYRIQAVKKIAACAGVHGARVQTEATFNIFVNDQGSRNTNKAGDLKVLS